MRAVAAFPVIALTLCAAAPLATAAQMAHGPTYVVFFKEWSAAIDNPASRVIGEAAKAAKAEPNATLLVTGYADTIGSTKANQYLTELRAQVVADALQADGVSTPRIKQAAEGSVPAVESRQESRRVTIRVQP